MSFIDADEYLIVMDMNTDGARLTGEELARLRDAGVKTVYYQAAVRWDVMQPEEGYPLDWTLLDEFVARGQRAGLKMLIPFLYSLPAWLPDMFFYSREQVGEAYGVPDYSNPEVTEQLDDFMREVIDRYGGDDVQVVYSIPANGEFALHIMPDHNRIEPYDMADFVEWVVGRQWLLAAQHNEVWTAFHPFTNPQYWRPVYDGLFSAFPMAQHYGILFTYVQHAGKLHHFDKMVRDNRKHSNMVYFGGVEYAQGLQVHAPELLADGVRMLCAPKHPWQPHRRIKDWMIDDMRWAMDLYRRRN